MLVVHVEIWPGGDPMAKRQIGMLTVANVSALADVSDYKFLATDGRSRDKTGEVKGHPRAEGFWKLLRRVLEQVTGE